LIAPIRRKTTSENPRPSKKIKTPYLSMLKSKFLSATCMPCCHVVILVTAMFSFISKLWAQTEYTADGSPTPLEEEIRWLMNRGRFNSAAENRTRGTSYTDIPANAPPLAVHHALTLACRDHSEDMARNSVFQHATVPNSSYYNATTQSQPWDRMTAKGYVWNRAAENIAAGYGSAESAYIGWWNSTGHRVNMYHAAMREVGNGYFYFAGSNYGGYYTMDLGSSGSTHFFTDTLFRDNNSNGKYDQGEAVAGIHIELRIDVTAHTWFDVSSTAGSFVIPIQTITDGVTVQVVLRNSGATTTTLSIPRDYGSNAVVTMPGGQEIVVGSFKQPTGTSNVGFRDLTPLEPPVNVPMLFSLAAPGGFTLRWSSETGVLYRAQWSTNLNTWTDLYVPEVAGTGSEISVIDTQALAGIPFRLYRLSARRP
jgi:hypothetical protein